MSLGKGGSRFLVQNFPYLYPRHSPILAQPLWFQRLTWKLCECLGLAKQVLKVTAAPPPLFCSAASQFSEDP